MKRDEDIVLDMIQYNMPDCIVTLELFVKLDLKNQIVTLCSTTKSTLHDIF